MRQTSLQTVGASFALGLLLLLAWLAFSPGLTGPFLFDDLPNLSPLERVEGDPQGMAKFVFGNASGPTGRPLSMATFLLDEQNWPAAASSFKRTNLLLHLLTGLCWLVLARQLLAAGAVKPSARNALALTATALWLLHPLQTATVLLVVQRMTILFSLFALLTLSALLKARDAEINQKPPEAAGWLLLAATLFMLGALCKEAIAVLPLLATVIERTIAPLPPTPRSRALRWGLLWLPSLALLCYLASVVQLTTYIDWRGFTPLDRFLTQGPVLFDYLRMIALPGIRTTLFNDTYPLLGIAARGPIAVLPWLVILTLIGFAWFGSARLRWLRFGILFFFAGHAIESSPVPLELFFVHRNYLPMTGLLLGLTVTIWQAFSALALSPRLAPALAALVLLLFAGITRLSAGYWGDAAVLFSVWASENPASMRARLGAASYWADAGDESRAYTELDGLLKHNPGALTAELGHYYLGCRLGLEEPAGWKRIRAKIDQNGYLYDSVAVPTFAILMEHIRSRSCKYVSSDEVMAAMNALTETPVYAHKDVFLIYQQMAIEFAIQGNTAAALGAAEHALMTHPEQSLWRLAAGLREGLGDKPGALAALKAARDADPRMGLGRWFIDDTTRRAELSGWIERLQNDISQHPQVPSTP